MSIAPTDESSPVNENNFSDLYTLDAKEWKHYKVADLNADQCKSIAGKCLSEGRWHRAKAIGWTVLGTLGVLLMISIALTTAKIAALVLAIVFLPAAPLLPLYLILCLTGSAAVGGAFAFFTIRAIYNKTFVAARENWNYANHLANEASNCEDRIIQLQKSD